MAMTVNLVTAILDRLTRTLDRRVGALHSEFVETVHGRTLPNTPSSCQPVWSFAPSWALNRRVRALMAVLAALSALGVIESPLKRFARSSMPGARTGIYSERSSPLKCEVPAIESLRVV